MVTHVAPHHGGSPVPRGPLPHASSHPGHSIPGGWADTACKTHTAGVSAGHPAGANGLPLWMPTGQVRQRPAPSPVWGTHRRGVSSSALALHACKGDPVPAPAPAQNRWQHYPPDLCHPEWGPEGLGARSWHGPSTPLRWQQGINPALGKGTFCGTQAPPDSPLLPPEGLLVVVLRTLHVPKLGPVLGTHSPGTRGGTSLALGLGQRVSLPMGDGVSGVPCPCLTLWAPSEPHCWHPHNMPVPCWHQCNTSAHAILTPMQHISAVLAPMQCWHSGITGAHITLLVIQHVCAVLVPMQHIHAKLTSMQLGAKATRMPMQCWYQCNTDASAMLAPTEH